MSSLKYNPDKYHPILAKAMKLDDKVPWVILSLLAAIGLTSYTEGWLGWHGISAFSTNTFVAWVAKYLCIMIFLAILGLEIDLIDLKSSGPFILLGILGGLLVPGLLTWYLTGKFYIGLAATATDVAFAVSIFGLVVRGKKILQLIFGALLGITVGDDLVGVMFAAAAFTKGIDGVGLCVIGLHIYQMWKLGIHGVEDIYIKIFGPNREVLPDDDPNLEILEGQKNVIENNPWKWLLASAFLSALLAATGIKWILGPCITLIAAPKGVKQRLYDILRPAQPWILAVFGFVSGTMNVAKPALWADPMLYKVALGGNLGKITGIFLFGLLARQILQKLAPNNIWARVPIWQIWLLAFFCSPNGTVIILFVGMAETAGKVDPSLAIIAKMGFILNLFISLSVVFILRFFVKENPNFLPPQPKEGEGDKPEFGHNPSSPAHPNP